MLPGVEATEQKKKSSLCRFQSAKNESAEEEEAEVDTLESARVDTSHIPQQVSQPAMNMGEQNDQSLSAEQVEQGTATQEHEETHQVERMTAEQPFTAIFCTDDSVTLTKKVGCVLVTSHLQEFLEVSHQSSHNHAFLQVYHMLSLLDKYLYENLKQHTHCMSSDDEYIVLLKYVIHLNIDLSMFLTIWAVLSILLDTQDGNQEYVKFLQEEYNKHYADRSRRHVMNLEKKSVKIQNCMYDSITKNFDRVSDLNDNALKNIDRIDRLETESEKSEDIVKTDAENVPMSDDNIDDATSGNINIEDGVVGASDRYQ